VVSRAAANAGARDLRASMLGAWRTSNRITVDLIERLPAALWAAEVPGAARRTIRMVAAHLHNSRCSWIRTLGREHGLTAPDRVDRFAVTRRQLAAALRRSGRGMEERLELGFAAGGVLPPSKGYVWRNLPLDVGHVLAYFVAHEGHHRGQIVMVARQLNQRLPREVMDRLWWWQSGRHA
jgi:uncharacterized damage-inducible protein DinB